MAVVETERTVGGDGAATADGSSISNQALLEMIRSQGEAHNKALATLGDKLRDASDLGYTESHLKAAQSRTQQDYYAPPGQNKVNAGSFVAIGQNEAVQIGEYPGMVTEKYGELWMSIPRPDGAFYTFRIRHDQVPTGTTGMIDGKVVKLVQDESGEKHWKILPVQCHPGELQVVGSVKYDDLDPSITGDATKKGNFFFKDNERPDVLKGGYFTSCITSAKVRFSMKGDYAIRYSKDIAGRYLNAAGEVIKVNDKGKVDPNGKEYFQFVRSRVKKFVIKDGKQVEEYDDNPDGTPKYDFYLADPDRPLHVLKDKDGKPLHKLTGNACPVVLQEGIYHGGNAIVDPRTSAAMLDPKHPHLGFEFENHFCINTGLKLSFKKTHLGSRAIPAGSEVERDDDSYEVEIIKDAKTGKDKEFRKGYHNYTDPETGETHKCLYVHKMDVDNGVWEYYRYYLDKDGLPIPEYKVPQLGERVALYQWGDTPVKVRQHRERFFHGNRSDIQSDGPSSVAEGISWHGRIIDKVSGEYMLTHLRPVGMMSRLLARAAGGSLGIVENDTLLGGKFNTAVMDDENNQNTFVYRAARKTSEFYQKNNKAGMSTDNLEALEWEYALARCMGDFNTATGRLGRSAKEFGKAGLVAGLTTAAVGTAIAGVAGFGLISILPIAAISVAAALIAGTLWYTAKYQLSRDRKDSISLEELDREADTASIYGDKNKGGKEVTETNIFGKNKGQEKVKPFSLPWNAVGLRNDLGVAIRGALGAMFILTGGGRGEAELNSEMWKNVSKSAGFGVAAGGVAGGALWAGLAGAGALTATLGLATVATVGVVATGALAVPAMFFAGKALLNLLQKKANSAGEEYANHQYHKFNEFKDIHLRVYNQDTVKFKDSRLRFGKVNPAGHSGHSLVG